MKRCSLMWPRPHSGVHRLLTGCGEVQVSGRRLLHQHFLVGQCPSLQSTSIQRGHRSQPPLVTLTSSLAGLNIRRGSAEACVSVLHSAGSFLGDVLYMFNYFWRTDGADNDEMTECIQFIWDGILMLVKWQNNIYFYGKNLHLYLKIGTLTCKISSTTILLL